MKNVIEYLSFSTMYKLSNCLQKEFKYHFIDEIEINLISEIINTFLKSTKNDPLFVYELVAINKKTEKVIFDFNLVTDIFLIEIKLTEKIRGILKNIGWVHDDRSFTKVEIRIN